MTHLVGWAYVSTRLSDIAVTRYVLGAQQPFATP